MGIAVGIDLGTTFSAVAYVNPKTGLPEIIRNREGKRLTPSVIWFSEDGEVFGSEAEDAYNAGEKNAVVTFKREMGSDSPYCIVDGKSYTSEDLSAKLLRHLKEDAEATIGTAIDEAVITVPAYFYSKEREATIRAAQAAGLKVKKIIDEPNAAAMTYGLEHWRENANILVYDLGGGTFDVTLVSMRENGVLSTVVTRGDHMLGGRDWDAAIEDIIIREYEKQTGYDVEDACELAPIIKGMAEGVKKRLSLKDSVKVPIRHSKCGNADVVVSREEFEDRTSGLLDRTGILCRAVLKEAGLACGDVTDVLLVGGSTKMPQVSAYLRKIFGKDPISHVNPDEAVALGAAIQSSKSNEPYAALSVQVVDGKKVVDRAKWGAPSGLAVQKERRLDGIGMLSLRETTAHAMGVVAVDDEGDRYYNEIIIPANHPRPVRAAKRFRFPTIGDSDNELAIYVLQGDDENPLKCRITGKYVVTGIRHVDDGGKLGTVIRIQYSYDANGVIRIQARQEDSTADLPIRQENVAQDDVFRFGCPVSKGSENHASGLLGLHAMGGGGQGLVHKYKAITFSNVVWKKYDNISIHPSSDKFRSIEPRVHVIANEKVIEFHGYNVSEMDEGVSYEIGPSDDFEIECDINTSTISPHPGGHLKICLGLISAYLDEDGGDILMGGKRIARVGSEFHLKMSLTNSGQYDVEVDGKSVGSRFKASQDDVCIRFGFVHESHFCELLSHAYVSDISMRQAVSGDGEDSSDTEEWDD